MREEGDALADERREGVAQAIGSLVDSRLRTRPFGLVRGDGGGNMLDKVDKGRRVVLNERVHRLEVRLLESRVEVGEALEALGDEGEGALRLGIRRRIDEGEQLGVEDGGDEEAQEDEGADRGRANILMLLAVLLRHESLDVGKDLSNDTENSSSVVGLAW